ncbi:MAG: FixH family protein [Motiliproteus sp.]
MSKAQSGWRSPWVIGFIVMGIIFVGANINMIYLAGKNAPSLVSENYYERGQDYEKNMLKRLAKNPGWHIQLVPPTAVILDQPAIFALTLEDKHGKFVDPSSVVLRAYRPTDASADFFVPMVKLSAGNYQAEMVFPLKGKWDLLASVIEDDHEFNVSQRISVKAP